MLFNSYGFVLFFLPITLVGFFTLAKYKLNRIAILWLVLASVVFYGSFLINYLLLLAVLIVINYLFGMQLSRRAHDGQQSLFILFLGIFINLGVLLYYKYTNFIVSNINLAFNTSYVFDNIILPIGISFFIFQKIAYLVDAYRGEAEEYNFLDFCLFVMYFPQLIAGPIVHHKDLIPQFREPSIFQLNFCDMAGGILMFIIGLCKKNLIADPLSVWVQPVFTAAHQGLQLNFLEAWGAALSFSFQIYFDFSAYTDMALGLALMIGIRLPLNFNSPYKAKSIIDFWRCWHISLSKFLRDYIYIPLGGNRKGTSRRYMNLLLTMLIGGLWHGAAWTFVLWGALHGFYLTINHAWRALKIELKFKESTSIFYSISSQIFTFLAVIMAWVFFRAESFSGATCLLKGMAGINGLSLPTHYAPTPGYLLTLCNTFGLRFDSASLTYFYGIDQILLLTIAFLIVWLLPNTQQFCSQFNPSINPIKKVNLNKWWQRIPGIQVGNNGVLTLTASLGMGILCALVLLGIFVAEIVKTTPVQSFIYFQF
jgi:alginate O-acetyltransferase complex protein AlgI